MIFRQVHPGDCIKFVALTQNLDNWQAAKMMVEAFNLPVDMKNTHLTKKKVHELKQQREADQKRKAVDQKKWVAEMDSLKTVIATCEDVLTNPHIEPMSDLWCSAVEQRNKSIIRANEMVGVETTPGRSETSEKRKAGGLMRDSHNRKRNN